MFVVISLSSYIKELQLHILFIHTIYMYSPTSGAIFWKIWEKWWFKIFMQQTEHTSWNYLSSLLQQSGWTKVTYEHKKTITNITIADYGEGKKSSEWFCDSLAGERRQLESTVLHIEQNRNTESITALHSWVQSDCHVVLGWCYGAMS